MLRVLLLVLSLLSAWPLQVTAQAEPPWFGGGAREVKKGSERVVGVYVINERPVASVDALPRGSVSHVLYAFLHLCGPGQVARDAQACKGRPDYDVVPHPQHRMFDAAFVRLKQRDPAVQVLASVGGWGGSDPIFHLAASAEGRAALVASMQRFLRAHEGFDGIDIDWEHPGSNGAANGVKLGSAEDGPNFALLMKDLRAGLDVLGKERARRYALTVAVNATAEVLDRIDWSQAAPPLDLVFLMTYDFHGPWTERAGHHSPLFSSWSGADDSLAQSVAHMHRHRVPLSKLVAGVAFYGRGFAGVAEPRPGVARQGLFPANEDGSIFYKDIARQYLDAQGRGRGGFEARFSEAQQAWSLFDAAGQRWIGYDDPRAVAAKARFARELGLAGVFAWELSQDNGDLLNAMNRGSGHRLLKSSVRR
ncbi:MAG: glycoside hydrolase family 18 protein [Burkholderiales bacterium]|nr:glycoside hydrolase family 18 protein [Burkholderiales bacterium]